MAPQINLDKQPSNRFETHRAVQEGRKLLVEKAKNFVIKNFPGDINQEITNSSLVNYNYLIEVN